MAEKMFGRECCLHADPGHVYILTAWETPFYVLTNDRGDVARCLAHEFTPISELGEDYLEATEDGRIEIIKDFMEILDSHSLPEIVKAVAGPPSRVRSPRGAGTGQASKAKGGTTEAQSEAKARVTALLECCNSREDIADIGACFLGDSAGNLLKKYEHLDNGRFRMVIGNRLRGLFLKTPGLSA